MKSRLRVALFSLAALLAFGSIQAIAAGEALAAPYFGGGSPQSFVFKGQETTVASSQLSLKCQSVSGNTVWDGGGGLQGPLQLKGCSGTTSGIPIGACSSTGAGAGEIVSKPLSDKLVYRSKVNHEVGMLFTDPVSGSPLANFQCGSVTGALRAGVLAGISPVSTLTTHFQVSAKGTTGSQELTQYEGVNGEKLSTHPELSVNGGAYQSADLNAAGLEIVTTSQTEIVLG